MGLNAAVADINASNEAKILAPGILSGKVNVQANSVAEALAEIYFASAGTVTVSNTFANRSVIAFKSPYIKRIPNLFLPTKTLQVF